MLYIKFYKKKKTLYLTVYSKQIHYIVKTCKCYEYSSIITVIPQGSAEDSDQERILTSLSFYQVSTVINGTNTDNAAIKVKRKWIL